MNTIDLNGRIAIITGGATGIGYACALRFLQSGASVELWGRDKGRLASAVETLAPYGPATFRSVNVAAHAEVASAARAAEKAYGKIDILFNCAGVISPVGPLSEVSVDAWHDNIAVNLNGVFYCCREFLPGMIRQKYGRIINASSVAGKEGNPFSGAYSAAKAGVIGLTKSMGKELATSGVLVNAIAPTLFDTPLVQAASQQAPKAINQSMEKIPMLRMGKPDEAAAMVAWLASEECSFTTGFTFDLSGGRATY